MYTSSSVAYTMVVSRDYVLIILKGEELNGMVILGAYITHAYRIPPDK